MTCRGRACCVTAVVILWMLAGTPALRAQHSALRFEHLTIDDGLSENAVMRILQDHRGFMWFGTQDGLDRYDGHHVLVFRNDPSDSSSLADGYVTALYEDSRGAIWVGTHVGSVDRLDPVTGRCTHVAPALYRFAAEGKAQITSIVEDSTHRIWIGSVGGGLISVDPASGACRTYTSRDDDSRSLSHDKVWALYVERSGVLWVATYNGLNRFDPRGDAFERFDVGDPRTPAGSNTYTAVFEAHDGRIVAAKWGEGLRVFDRTRGEFVPWDVSGSGISSHPEKRVWCFAEDRDRHIWMGTRDGGLLCADGSTVQGFVNEPDDPSSLTADEVVSLCIDRSGTLWIGTTSGGVNRYSCGYRHFSCFRHSAGDPGSIAANTVWAFLEDRAGDLWVGTTGGGLDHIDRRSGRIVHYRAGSPGAKGLTSEQVIALCEDTDGAIWIGTKDAGVFRFDRGAGTFTRYHWLPGDSTSLGFDAVNSLCVDHAGTLWVGTFYGGLSRFDRSTGRFTRFLHRAGDPRALSDNTVFPIVESRKGGLWVGLLSGGLDLFRDGVFTHYLGDSLTARDRSRGGVLCVHEDRSGTLWVGTMGGGLNRFDERTGKFIRYAESEGLPNSTVYGILEDDHGDLWISTNLGLAKFDVARGRARGFTDRDGLQSNEFNAGAYLRLRNGEMLFGGIGGFNRFHPDSVRGNLTPPGVALTAFTVLGAREQSGRGSPPSSVLLTYAQNSLSLEFAALEFTDPAANRCAYKLEGFDGDWVNASHGYVATYTNLRPGKYTFRAAASNNDGVWTWDAASIPIVIVPPWWETWWANVLYLAGGIGAVLGYVRLRTHKHARAMLEKENKLREKEEHANLIRSSLHEKEMLLKEVHHRVKNNMQVISSLLNLQRSQSADPAVNAIFRDMQERVRSMALVHEKLYQSMDMASIDFGNYLASLMAQVTLSSSRPGISYSLDVDPLHLGINVAIPCGLIVNELVSNACEHAFVGRDSGTIIVSMKRQPDATIDLSVADDGTGFPPGLDPHSMTSMGMTIVTTLASQLSGDVTIRRDGGTTVSIRFPE